MLLMAAAAADAPVPAGTRLKDLATIEGVRENPLIGYGLVVGLNGTGDKRQTVFPAQTLANLLERMGVQVAPTAMQVKNTAAVMVTATLPPFAQPGSRIDVTVAAVGDAGNLQGGLLVMAPLRAPDGTPYALAQGQVVTGGFAARGGASAVAVNHPTAGRIPQGAIVERAAPSVAPSGRVRLQLRQAEFSTAARVAAAINRRFDAATPIAASDNSALVSVTPPPEYAKRMVDFIAALEDVRVEADGRTRVVVNERTGTIVMGRDVRVRPVAILHGALSVEIQTTYEVSQPAPLSQGKTEVVPQTTVGAREEKAKTLTLHNGASVDDLVKALQAIGSTPRDVIAILQSLKAAGALEAELEVI
jgi:flagellar P-ring protein precursor FlgI